MLKYALVDCNNFFVSCERVFNPKLRNKPVVVLSSNDACVIARSKEAKALGIPMGIPAFKCEQLFRKHNVILYSSNFALYGDMSARVMKTLAELAPDIEIYSIDEAFLFLPNPTNELTYWSGFHTTYAHFIKEQVYKRTGIPVTIGIGPTKTLAKIATKIAKQKEYLRNVLDISDLPNIDLLLESIDVKDIWGIGSRYARLLKNKGIYTARDFKYLSDAWVKKNMTVVGYKTLLELRGTPCLSLCQIPEEKKSLTVSRSFGKNVMSLVELKEALANYMLIAAKKLRNQKVRTTRVTVFVVYTHYFETTRFYNAHTIVLTLPSSYSPTLIKAAYRCLEALYNSSYVYKKVGVLLDDFVTQSFVQLSTYIPYPDVEKECKLMKVVDTLNQKLGINKVTVAAAGFKHPWKMKQTRKSKCFTTSWTELLVINL